MKRRDFLSGLALTSASLAAANIVGKTNGNLSPIEQAATPQAAPMVQEMTGVSAAGAAGMVGIISIANGAGR